MPLLLFHAPNILHINHFFVYYKVNKTKDVNYKKEHKQFNMDFVSALQNKTKEYRENKNATTTRTTTQSSVAALAMLLPLEQRQPIIVESLD